MLTSTLDLSNLYSPAPPASSLDKYSWPTNIQAEGYRSSSSRAYSDPPALPFVPAPRNSAITNQPIPLGRCIVFRFVQNPYSRLSDMKNLYVIAVLDMYISSRFCEFIKVHQYRRRWADFQHLLPKRSTRAGPLNGWSLVQMMVTTVSSARTKCISGKVIFGPSFSCLLSPLGS